MNTAICPYCGQTVRIYREAESPPPPVTFADSASMAYQGDGPGPFFYTRHGCTGDNMPVK